MGRTTHLSSLFENPSPRRPSDLDRLTVVDLTASSRRWPTGNPRDLKTFRYCGEFAHGGPYFERHARLAYLQRAA
jgi:hypothetical protein